MFAGGELFKNSAGRVEPPSDGLLFALVIVSFCFGFLPLLPLFVARSARKEALMYFATHNITMGNEASQRSHRWLKYTYITFGIIFITGLLIGVGVLVLTISATKVAFTRVTHEHDY
eukprot:GEMP01059345.1.p1 GENE.GEMP01059345.1~~GEMP01059345.1.p1  ORF type:complete len:117 (+),score=13.47 GEMP01059345.1:188-538(+)